MKPKALRYVAAAGAMCLLPIAVDMEVVSQLNPMLSVAAGSSAGLLVTSY